MSIRGWGTSAVAVMVLGYILGLSFIFNHELTARRPPPSPHHTPAEAGAPALMHAVAVPLQDGTAIELWYAPASRQPYTLIIWHGTDDTMADFIILARPLIEAGYGVVLAEYPGYFGMPGSTTRVSFENAARATIKTILQLGIAPHHLILFGYSLGTGIATHMANEFAVGGLILTSPYLHALYLTSRLPPPLAALFLQWDQFENDRSIRTLQHIPLLIIHGDRDTVIPIPHAEALYKRAPEPKTLQILHGAGHDNLLNFGFLRSLQSWLTNLPKP